MSKAGPHDPAFLERLMRLQRTGGRGAVGLVLGDFAASCGFNHFAYHVVRRPAPAPAPDDLHTYPGRWIRHYDQQGYARLDAPLVLAGREVLAFRWETAIARSGITPVQQRIFEEARDFGVGDGVTLPCHGPGGGLAVISFARPVLSARESFAEGRYWTDLRPAVQMVGLAAHEALMTQAAGKAGVGLNSPLAATSGTGEPASLSPRESDVLAWLARGQSPDWIGEKLGISDTTVTFHLRNAMSKLDVHSRHLAVVRAIMGGLIHP